MSGFCEFLFNFEIKEPNVIYIRRKMIIWLQQFLILFPVEINIILCWITGLLVTKGYDDVHWNIGQIALNFRCLKDIFFISRRKLFQYVFIYFIYFIRWKVFLVPFSNGLLAPCFGQKMLHNIFKCDKTNPKRKLLSRRQKCFSSLEIINMLI